MAIGQPPEAEPEPEPKLLDPEETVEVISEEPFTKNFRVTDEVKNSFDKEGFFILRSLFSNEEVGKLLLFFNSSEEIKKYAFAQEDGAERKTKVSLWKYVGDDVGDMASRSRRVVDTFEQLLGGEELYHYHSKLMMKEAETGGQHVWHQDYGYWYENGCLTPDMGSVFIALDPSVKANGCLQVLAGSHKMGRVDTQLIGDGEVTQRGADLGRVEMARKRYPHVFVELQPGDAVFFHSNLLHTSAQNVPMTNITFDGVRVLGAQSDQRASYHTCTGVASGVALGDTFPVPPCFEDKTNAKHGNQDL